MKSFAKKILPLLIILTQACTKDRVANPESLNKEQVTIYNETFGEIPFFPSGWSASPSAGGWSADTSATNISTGYKGASAGANIVISNPATGSAGDFTVISKSMATTHYNSISVTYGARMSKHFTDNKSKITGFYYSVDDGKTWVQVQYAENPNDSNWYLINSGTRMNLGADADNQPSVKFKWTAHLEVTSSGTYRIDDFQVFGTSM